MEKTKTFQVILLISLIFFIHLLLNTLKALAVFVLWENISVCYYSISLLELRNFHDCMIRIRWQMPTYSVGASYFFIQSGILRPQK